MPTYQYACTACEEQLEVVQKFTDDPLTVCSECGGKLRKVFSPVGIVFKGSGFYRTDSRNGAAAAGSKDKQPAGSANGSSAPAEAPASTSADSGSASGEAKSAKKADSASTGGSPPGAKVA